MKETTEAPNEAPVEQPAAQAAEPDPFAVIEKLNAENAELKDRLLRALAEMENLRRRTEREVADARAYGVANLARDMLSVADNLARAVESFPAEERAAADAALKALIEGVELTERDLHAALGRYGVTKLSPEGEKFDPNFHQAMFEMPQRHAAGRVGGRRRAERLEDRRTGAAPGPGRRLQGRPQGRAEERRRPPPAGVDRLADAADGRVRLTIAAQRRGSTRHRRVYKALRHPPQRQVDPPALGEQGRTAGVDAVDAVEGQPGRVRRASSRRRRRGGTSGSARRASGRRRGTTPCRRATARRRAPTAPLRRGPDAGPCARARVVEVDQARFGRRRAGRERGPDRQQPRRHRRPGRAGLGMGRLVAVAALSSETQPSGPQLLIRTENGLPVLGMRGTNGGAAARTARDFVAQRLLAGAVEIAGIVADAGGDFDGDGHRRGTVLVRLAPSFLSARRVV